MIRKPSLGTSGSTVALVVRSEPTRRTAGPVGGRRHSARRAVGDRRHAPSRAHRVPSRRLPAEALLLPPPLPPFLYRGSVRQVVHHDLPWVAGLLLALFGVTQAVVDRRDPRLSLARRRRDEDVGEP